MANADIWTCSRFVCQEWALTIHALSCSDLTEWEREREKEEFARSAALYQPLNSTMAARFTSAKQPDDHRIVYEEVPAQESSDSSDQTQAASMKMFGKLTRDSFEWHPENTLCKRFNIPNPYPGSRLVGVPKVRRPKFTLGDLITPQQPRALTHEQLPTSEMLGTISKSVDEPIPSDPKSADSELVTKAFVPPSVSTSVVEKGIGSGDTQSSELQGHKMNETQNEGVNSAPKRPSMDLFKAIFADSSSDESQASDQDEDESEKAETEPISIQASENKPQEKSSNSHVDLRTEDNNLGGRFTSNQKTLNQGSPSTPTGKELQKTDMQAVVTENAKSEEVESASETFGPAPPSNGHQPSSSHSFSRKKHSVDTAQNEDSERRKRKEKRKDTKKRYSDSTDSEDEYRSKHKRKHKEKKKHKHKHEGKHRDDEKERLDKKSKGHDCSSQPLGQTRVSEDKKILSKLKNLQNLKAGKRMRAADFMWNVGLEQSLFSRSYRRWETKTASERLKWQREIWGPAGVSSSRPSFVTVMVTSSHWTIWFDSNWVQVVVKIGE